MEKREEREGRRVLESGEKSELGTSFVTGMTERPWVVVRIIGPDCLRVVDGLVSCGAVIYCPVVIEMRRNGRTRRRMVMRKAAAYPGWAFMLRPPDPDKLSLRPWLRFKVIAGEHARLSDGQIDAIKADEALWNKRAEERKRSVRLAVGDQVLITGGFMKGFMATVIEDEGSWVRVRIREDSSLSVRITPFLLQKSEG